jgi:predicted RNA-binding Zn-ribbon protein involved in translation (DUF1610 family)
VTQAAMVQVICPDCRKQFDVLDGAVEAQCPQCGQPIVWRSCLDTNEVFTVLKAWETWVHPGCNTRHPVDLTEVIAAPAPQSDDTSSPRHVASDEVAPPAGEQVVYSPVQLAEDVEWADQAISGRLIVDSERLAILPGAGIARPPLSIAWLRDILDYSVQHADGDGDGDGDGKKRKMFGRARKDAGVVSRPTLLAISVPTTQILITVAAEAPVLQAQLDEFLRPRITGNQAPDVAPPAAEAATPPISSDAQTAPAEAPAAAAPEAAAPEAAGHADPASLPDLEPETPEGVYESIRKLAELAVLGTISSEEFAAKKAQLLARL